MRNLILVINPGSTSTKISVYEGAKELFTKTLRHTSEELAPYSNIKDQTSFRTGEVKRALGENNIKIENLDIIVARGGLLHPIPSGVYGVNDKMLKDVESACYGEHASNLGAMVANEIVTEIKNLFRKPDEQSQTCLSYAMARKSCTNVNVFAKQINAIIADPVVVDELEPIARITGLPIFPKRSIFHALNQKAIAKRYAKEQGKEYKDLNIIVAHLGGGVSVGIHNHGRIVDVNDALNGDGPFSPERSGTLPAMQVAELCFSGKHTLQEVKRMINGKGGVVAHLGTNSFAEVEKRVDEGDKEAKLISDAFGYNIAKAIGGVATVVEGKVDAILITGGVAYNTPLMKQIEKRVSFIAPVTLYPGEDEMGALASNALAVLNGTEEIKNY